jgi:2-isopropylmalate synthase
MGLRRQAVFGLAVAGVRRAVGYCPNVEFSPEDVGFATTELVLGKHSGRAALAARVKALGYTLSAEQIHTVFESFKILADKKKEIYDADIAALVEQEMRAVPELWALVSYSVSSGTGQVPQVHLRLRRGGKEMSAELACGDGPVDAIFLAIEQLTGIHAACKDFNVHSVTVGKDAQGEVMVQVEHHGQLYRGRGVSTDSIEASAMAFINAVNKIAAATAGGVETD